MLLTVHPIIQFCKGPRQNQLADLHNGSVFSSKELEINQMPNTWGGSRQTGQMKILPSSSRLWLPADVGGKYGPLPKKEHTHSGAGQKFPHVPDGLGQRKRVPGVTFLM